MAAPGTNVRDHSEQPLDLSHYPTPLSPPYPELSRSVELRRAMSASSRSALFALTAARIVFQDEWLAVFNKPPGIYCEALLSAFSAFLSPGNVYAPGSPGKPQLHLANRLDRDTSGLMVITKSHKEAAAKLVRAFTEHSVSKTYIALCVGRAPEWRRICVVSGHGRSRHGAWRVYAASDVGRVLPGGSVIKHMETSFEVLSVNGVRSARASDVTSEAMETVVVEGSGSSGTEGAEPEVMLVRAYPRSGRTHQIRLHCQYLGMPIWGDVKYGGVHEWNGEECEAHDLHAESLSFDHPVSGSRLQFQAPLPTWASISDGR